MTADFLPATQACNVEKIKKLVTLFTCYTHENICLIINNRLVWKVEFHDDFESEFDVLPEEVKDELLATAKLLEEFGSQLKRPHADTLNGSEYSNMKELRFNAGDGVWRVAFAFDPKRQAILLVAGDKSGVSQKQFYKQLIKKADARYNNHLIKLKQEDF